MHAWDELTPGEEVMRAFDDFVRAGKVLYPSAFPMRPRGGVARANTLAELRGLDAIRRPADRIQPYRAHRNANCLPMAEALGLTVLRHGHRSRAAGSPGKIHRQIQGRKAARQNAAIRAAHRTQRGHRQNRGQSRESRQPKSPRPGRAQLAARCGAIPFRSSAAPASSRSWWTIWTASNGH